MRWVYGGGATSTHEASDGAICDVCAGFEVMMIVKTQERRFHLFVT